MRPFLRCDSDPDFTLTATATGTVAVAACPCTERHNEVPDRPSRRSGQAMPERAAETRQVSDDTREELIAKAAGELAAADGGVAPPGDLGRAVGDLPGFLTAYYRLVAAEDLMAAGPARLAATAAQHAALGVGRPQGRAAVSVRPGVGTSLTGAGTVIDIVTDDMPYLVDSVTMELNRLGADILLIVHPRAPGHTA